MTIQQAAIFGNALGLTLRTLVPFLMKIWKKQATWADWNWDYMKPLYWALLPAAGTSVGIPLWLQSWHVPETHPLFVPIVFVACAGTAYLSQDAARETMRSDTPPADRQP